MPSVYKFDDDDVDVCLIESNKHESIPQPTTWILAARCGGELIDKKLWNEKIEKVNFQAPKMIETNLTFGFACTLWRWHWKPKNKTDGIDDLERSM